MSSDDSRVSFKRGPGCALRGAVMEYYIEMIYYKQSVKQQQLAAGQPITEFEIE